MSLPWFSLCLISLFEDFIEFAITLLLFYGFVFFFFFLEGVGQEVCGVLAARPGIKPTTPALEGQVLTTGPPGKFPFALFLTLHNNLCHGAEYLLKSLKSFLRVPLSVKHKSIHIKIFLYTLLSHFPLSNSPYQKQLSKRLPPSHRKLSNTLPDPPARASIVHPC